MIRLEETNIIGPHHLMLACTLAIVGLGYQWRDRPTVQAAIGLGAVIAFGALSMTYVIPATLCWAVAAAWPAENGSRGIEYTSRFHGRSQSYLRRLQSLLRPCGPQASSTRGLSPDLG